MRAKALGQRSSGGRACGPVGIGRAGSLALAAALTLLLASPSQAESIFDVITAVVASHPDIKSADRLELAAEADRGEAISGYFPVVGLDGSIGYDQRDRVSGLTQLQASEIGVTLTQPLFDGFRTYNRVRAAEAALDVAGYEIETRQVRVAFEAASTYIDVLRARELATAAVAHRGRVETIAGQLRERMAADPGLAADVTVGQSRLLEAGVASIAAGTSRELAAAQFKELVGHAPNGLTAVSLANLNLPKSVDDALTTGQFSHPAIKAASSQIDHMQGLYEADNSALLPRLDLLGKARLGDNLDGVAGRSNSLYAGVKFTYQLATGGGDFYHSKSSQERMSSAIADEAGVVLQVRQQILSAWSDWRTASDIYSAVSKRRQNAVAMVSDYEGQFEAGERNLLDFFFVLSERYAAETAEIQARYDRLTAAFRLLAAMGIVPA